MFTPTKTLSGTLYALVDVLQDPEGLATTTLIEAAERLDMQTVAINNQRREIDQLTAALEALIDEPQPLGIARPAYQQALSALGITERGEKEASA